FRHVIQLDPQHATAHAGLGTALRRKGRIEEAIAHYRKALEFDPKRPLTSNLLGQLLCDEKRDYAGAIACFRKAIALQPNNPKFHFNLGVALAGKGQLDDAIACYRKATELDPKKTDAHHNLGKGLARKGRLAEAVASFHKASELDPQDPIIHADLGTA